MTDLKICERVKGTMQDYRERGPINIVIIGDSVSHGCFAAGEHDYDAVYHNRLRLMINQRYPDIPVNVINTAIGGTSARFAVLNFERDVLPHKPDLVIICFGLNDINGELGSYTESLGGIFDKCRKNGFDCVFMTPNMLNTYVAEDTPVQYFEYAGKTAVMQNEGRMDTFMNAARALCSEKNVPLCDVYSKWKSIAESGTDTTSLLANRINHPTKKMHILFAEMLYETIFGEKYEGKSIFSDDGMIKI